MAAAFTDPDGDALVYSAGSSDGSRLMVNVNGTTGALALDALAAGNNPITITVTARDPVSMRFVSQMFQVTVDGAPSFAGQTIANQVYPVGVEIATLTLPLATGGNSVPNLLYTLTPVGNIPAGLTFTNNNSPGVRPRAPTLTGTPTTPGEYTLIYRAADLDDNTTPEDAASLEFTISVNAFPTITTGGFDAFGNPITLPVEENTTLVGTVMSTNVDDAITGYALTGFGPTRSDDDGALFEIDANGVLSFRDPPDFENPADNDRDGDGGDNVYRVEVTD